MRRKSNNLEENQIIHLIIFLFLDKSKYFFNFQRFSNFLKIPYLKEIEYFNKKYFLP